MSFRLPFHVTPFLQLQLLTFIRKSICRNIIFDRSSTDTWVYTNTGLEGHGGLLSDGGTIQIAWISKCVNDDL